MELFGLADCNNFFCSCERVFRPDLHDKPVVVLSNNDGIIVALSQEAKKLGLRRGDVYFKVKGLIERYSVAVFSSNYVLYGDLSKRVMSMLSGYSPRLDVYSIDEAFLDFSNMFGSLEDLVQYGQGIVAAVRRGVGIPISLGIAPTKTLAKIASKFAKSYPGYKGCCLIDTEVKREKALKLFPVEDVWGIGRRFAPKLREIGVKTAWDFTQLSPELVRKMMHEPGVKTWRELRGESCVSIDELPAKQSICTSRSFPAEGVAELSQMREAVADFAARTALKLRQQGSVCGQMIVFYYTSRYRTDSQSHYVQVPISFSVPTSSDQEIMPAVMRVVEQTFRPGCLYKKAGVIAYDISQAVAADVQVSLFDEVDRSKLARVQSAVDAINARGGFGSVRPASQSSSKYYKLQADHISGRYTTEWDELIKLYVR